MTTQVLGTSLCFLAVITIGIALSIPELKHDISKRQTSKLEAQYFY